MERVGLQGPSRISCFLEHPSRTDPVTSLLSPLVSCMLGHDCVLSCCACLSQWLCANLSLCCSADQAWADGCVFKHDDSYNGGENLAMGTALKSPTDVSGSVYAVWNEVWM